MHFSTTISTLLLLPLLPLLHALPTPQTPPTCANPITFKSTFSLGDGFANTNLQSGPVHCFVNVRFTGDATVASGTPSAPFYLACDDGGVTSATFTDHGSTGTLVVYGKDGVRTEYAATATRDVNAVFQFVQQVLCPS